MSDDEKTIPEPRDPLQWAKDLVDRKATVMHLPTGRIGRVERLYDGQGQLYVSPSNNMPVKSPVLELEGGNSFVAAPGQFTEFSDREQDYVKRASAVLRKLAQDFAMLSSATQVPPKTAMMILASLFRMHADDLDTTRQRRKPAAPAG